MRLLGGFGQSARTRAWAVLDGLRSKELNIGLTKKVQAHISIVVPYTVCLSTDVDALKATSCRRTDSCQTQNYRQSTGDRYSGAKSRTHGVSCRHTGTSETVCCQADRHIHIDSINW